MPNSTPRKSNGTYSLTEVAEELGVSPQRVLRWLDEEKRPLKRRANGRSRRFSGEDLRPLERRQPYDDIRLIFANPDRWLERPNRRTGGDTPREAIEGGNEQLVLDIVLAIKHGMIS
ncbi:MAG TPA: helix-turn-helix domain-containing protein [Pirellulales bacterium]|nr:helix-turn-helix domain-containing protein [Pirellulales bacterium]